MSDIKTRAKEALIIIGEGTASIYIELTTDRLSELYCNAETVGKWCILEELSKRDDCPTEKVLTLAKDYTGEIGMTILWSAIKSKLSMMTLEDLLINLSRLHDGTKQTNFDLAEALRYEIIRARLPKLSIEEVLGISYGEDSKVVEAVKQALHEREKELRALAV